jgi:hypothetical protein
LWRLSDFSTYLVTYLVSGLPSLLLPSPFEAENDSLFAVSTSLLSHQFVNQLTPPPNEK